MGFLTKAKAGLAALVIGATPVARTQAQPYVASGIEEAAQFYHQEDRKDLEHIIAYDADSSKQYNITAAQTPVSAAPDQEQLDSLLYGTSNLEMTHNHPVSIDAYTEFLAQNGRPDIAHKVLQQDPKLVKKRLLFERPSDADVNFMLLTQLKGYLAREDSTITQRIAVMENGKPIRFIEYGLSPQAENAYRDMALEFRECAKQYEANPTRRTKQSMVRAGKRCASFVNDVMESYYTDLRSYDSRRLQPGERGPKPEPSFDEFKNHVNSGGLLEIRDLGYKGEPIYTPQLTVPYAA
jgi:hypothetical protein